MLFAGTRWNTQNKHAPTKEEGPHVFDRISNIRSAVSNFISIRVCIKRWRNDTFVGVGALTHRDRGYNLIHSIYRRNAQLKGIRLDKAVREGREAGLRGELPVRERHAKKKK